MGSIILQIGSWALRILPWIGKQFIKRPITSATIAHVASDGNSTKLIREKAEEIGNWAVDAVANLDPETAENIRNTSKNLAQETWDAWGEMGHEGMALAKSLGVEVSDQIDPNVLNARKPVKKAIVGQTLEDISIPEKQYPIDGETNSIRQAFNNLQSIELRNTFNNVVKDISLGNIQLDWKDKLQFNFIRGVAGIFNAINLFGIMDPVVDHLKATALNLIKDEFNFAGEGQALVPKPISKAPSPS